MKKTRVCHKLVSCANHWSYFYGLNCKFLAGGAGNGNGNGNVGNNNGNNNGVNATIAGAGSGNGNGNFGNNNGKFSPQ